MKQIFFSAASVLLLILVASAIAFNPLTVRAQMEHVMTPDILINQPIKPTATKEEIKDILGASISPIITKESFEELHKDKSLIFELDEFEVKVNKDYSYQTRTKKRVKILNESVIEDLGELAIPYNSSRANTVSLKAHTIAPDGKIYPVKEIQDLNRYDMAMYSDMRDKVLTFSHVTVGSILEYEVIVDHSRGSIKDTYFIDFYLNFSSPTKEENISFTFPMELNIAYKEFNLKFKPKVTEDNNNTTYSWHIKDMYEEPLREGMIPPSDEFLQDCFQFSSIKSWDDVSSWYYALIKKNLIISPEIASKARGLTKDYQTTREKTQTILEYLQKEFRYVSMSFGDNGLEPHPTTEVFYNKYGDCKDLSLLCMALLKSVNIDSSIALFNTEHSITDPSKDLPLPTLFDHVILLVRDPETKDFYIDPLFDGYDIDEYPLSFQRAYTFIIGESKGEFRRFPEFSKERCYKESNFIIEIEPDGSATSENSSVWGLDFSIRMRNRFKSMTDEERRHTLEYIDNIISDGGKIIERRIDGINESYGPLRSYAKVYNKDEYPITDGMMIIDLTSFNRHDEFTKKKRTYPIFYPYNSIEEKTIEYKIPKGFKITHMPEDLSLDNGIFLFRRTFKKEKNALIVTATEECRRAELPKEKYESLREFNDALSKKTRQRIVLTCKKSLLKRLFGR